jgi:hypothetical protein
MQQYMDRSMMWVPKVAKVMEVAGINVKGGYREICKFVLSKITNIPTMVDFARKESKATI